MSESQFDAKVVINTADATAGLRALDQVTKSVDQTFRNLDTALASTQGKLTSAAAALKSLVESQRQATAAAKSLADAQVAQSRAEGVAIQNQTRLADAANRRAESEARVARTLAQTTNATTRGEQANTRFAQSQERLAQRSAAAAAASLEVTDHLSNSRYLLYDVSATYGLLSTALLAIPAATAAVATSYEKDFAQVLRTNDTLKGNTEEIYALRDGLKDLGEQIPVSFGELSKIATIGGQLGVAKEDIEAFTETVAKFGAASNVTTEDAATAFGRLENSFPDDARAADFFNKIGSAIAYVGVKSVASETEIIAVVNQLAPLAAQAGFSAQQVVGLSGALASVRIRPELARGSFTRVLSDLTAAADQGAPAFETYAKYLNMTGEAGLALFKSDPSAFFTQFIGGIKGTIDAGNSFNQVFADIGLKNVRDKQFVLALANGYNVLTDSMGNAQSAYDQGTFLDESTAGIFETVAAKLERLGTAFKNLADSLGGSSLGVLGGLADAVLGLVSGFSSLVDQFPAVGAGINVLLGIGAVTGVFLAFKAAQAAALAGVVAFRQVVGSNIQGSISLRGVLSELSVTMLQLRGATLAQAQAFVASNGAMAAMRTGAISSNIATKELQIGMTAAGTASTGLVSGVKSAGSALLGMAGGPVGIAIIAVTLLGGAFMAAADRAKEAGDAIGVALAQGAEDAYSTIATSLNKIKVAFTDDTALVGGAGIGENLRQVADKTGVSFEAMVKAVSKGKDALAAFTPELDRVARSKGFKDYQDLATNSLNFQNQAGQLRFLAEQVDKVGKNASVSADDTNAASDAQKNLAGTAGTAGDAAETLGAQLGESGDGAEDATKAIEDYINAVFGIINAQAATQDSLQKLGEGIAKSTSFSVGDEGGRDNMANLEQTFKNAALEQQNLIDSGEATAEQAQANYIAFVDGLLSELGTRGVNTTQIQSLAEQSKSVFGSQLNSGEQPQMAMGVKVDEAKVNEAKAYLQSVVDSYGTLNITALMQLEGGEQTAQNVFDATEYIKAATGQPFVANVAADTTPASNDTGNLVQFMLDCMSLPFLASVNVDTTPAIAGITNFVHFALDAISKVGGVLGSIAGFANKALPSISIAAPAQVQSTPRANPNVPKAPTPTAAKVPTSSAPATPDFTSLNDGYKGVGDAAKGAGDAGKQAGKDMADGAKDAAAEVEDYAKRLKAALTDAYDRQYGLQSATDDYYKALNAINKKRQDDIKAIQDAIDKQKELNNARNGDLIDAKKAGTEKDISLRYGEIDRAADYANQEQTALDAAAAKQKDIEANQQTQTSLEQGLNALTGYSDAAIANREALRNLEAKMLDMVTAYAATGASQAQVDAYTQNLTAQFNSQVGQIGYNRGAVAALQGDMSRYIGVVKGVPTRVTTEATTSGMGAAQTAANNLAGAINAIPNNKLVTVEMDFRNGVREIPGQYYQGQQVYGVYDKYGNVGPNKIFNKGGEVQGYASGGMIGGTPPSNPGVDNLMASVDGKGMVKVRSGEFIMQQPAVDFWGLDMMNALNNMKMPRFNMGGPVGNSAPSGAPSGVQVVELTAEALAAIQRAGDRPIYLYADAREIANTVNEANTVMATKGAN